MFHAARAVLFGLGLREKRHFAIGVVLEDLNKKGKLESSFVNDFNAAVSAREGADYHYTYSKEAAQHSLPWQRSFFQELRSFQLHHFHPLDPVKITIVAYYFPYTQAFHDRGMERAVSAVR
ncbi:MAG: HEPN domain-containing protein [Thaumarchaeota archaeon]|nr:HEPN domain-containing protein [Nitrososphaerota archaeon]